MRAMIAAELIRLLLLVAGKTGGKACGTM